MASVSIKFGNYTIAANSWSESVPQRIETVKVPRRDGALVSDGRPEAKRITVRGMLGASTAEGLRTLEDALLAALRGTAGGSPIAPLRLFDDRYINAQLDSWQREYENGYNKVLRWSAGFLAATPYWLSDTLSTSTNYPNASPYPFNVTGAGTAAAPPAIIIAANGAVAAGLKITNTAANAFLQYGAAMDAGDRLSLDHENLTAEKNGVNVLADITGDFWSILPGINTINAYGLSGSTISVSWRNRWY